MVRLGLGLVVIFTALSVAAVAQPEAYVTWMSGDGIEGLYITEVPDASQPPPNPLGFRSVSNWCAPLAAANAIVFLDQVAEADWAIKVTGGLSPNDLSAYLGWFMATNGEGSRDRLNASHGWPGTLSKDIPDGVMDYAKWDGEPLPNRMWKERHSWLVEPFDTDSGVEALWEAYRETIEKGVPAILCFTFWNPIKPTQIKLHTTSDKEPGLFTFYLWGEPITSTGPLRKENPKIPEEEWNEKLGIGHAVTGVGFLKGDPDGSGPLPKTFWIIVHDNWSTTAEDVVIPWDHVTALITMSP